MAGVVIGVDPAKRSNTIEVIDDGENVLLAARFDNTREDYRRMLALVKRFPKRKWAVEGAAGVGLNLAQRLVSDGERVVDVPSKLSTRVRAIDTGHGRKNDPSDAHAVAVVGLRTAGLREVSVDDEVVVMRLLSDRRRDLVRELVHPQSDRSDYLVRAGGRDGQRVRRAWIGQPATSGLCQVLPGLGPPTGQPSPPPSIVKSAVR